MTFKLATERPGAAWMDEGAMRAIARADLVGAPLTLRAGGAEVDDARRDEMLQQVRAGAYVELDVAVLAFEQMPGVSNRNHVRFRDGAMMKLGRSGKGKPFLRDHEQYDSNAVAGTIVDSKAEKRGEGDYAIKLTARLTAPWAVELALRGLVNAVSIGWWPTGPVECSACKASVFTKCYHWPGDRLREDTDADGNTVKVRDRNGPIVVEWIYTDAELIECSLVPIPAVPGAHIEGVRTALAARFPEFRAELAPDGDGLPAPTRKNSMNFLAALVACLSLAPTAGEDDVVAAVKGLKRERDTVAAKLEIAETERVKLAGDVERYREVERKGAEDAFIREALSAGKITVGDEPLWRKLFALDQDGAKADMGKRAVGCATPVGLPRQAGAEPEDKTPAAAAAAPADLKAAIAATGADPAMTLELAKKFGVKDPAQAISQALGLTKEA